MRTSVPRPRLKILSLLTAALLLLAVASVSVPVALADDETPWVATGTNLRLESSNYGSFDVREVGYIDPPTIQVVISNPSSQTTAANMQSVELTPRQSAVFTFSESGDADPIRLPTLGPGASATITICAPAGLARGSYAVEVRVMDVTVDPHRAVCGPITLDFQVNETTYALTVNNGTGGGDFAAGTQVPITANAAPSGQVFDRWTTSGGGTFANANSASTTFTMPAAAVTVTATYKSSSNPNPNPAPTYTYRTLIDQPTGITVKGRMTQATRLAVKDQILHTGTCDACDEIRSRQAEGRILIYADIALSGGYSGDQEVSLPVDPQYNGRTVTILHCNYGVLEQVVVTVQNGMATGKFSKLSPYAVMIGERIGVPDQILVAPPKTGDNNTPFGFLLVLMALAISAKAVRVALKK